MSKRARRSRRLLRDEGGIAAIEFALIAPTLCLLLAGVSDYGGALYTKFKLDAAVAAGANYAQVNAANVSSTNGASLATNIAAIVENAEGSNSADNVIVVNNGPSVTDASGGSSSGGTPSGANACYCPTGTSTALSWGVAATCSSACPGGGLAGKFVTVTASAKYTPIFSSYGLIKNDTITAGATVQTQ
jgi:Flp pilus assembly protein TadG